MTDARYVTRNLGGKWHGSYGTAPCPICQPERRRDQTALTVRQTTTRLLLHCKKSNCDFRDIIRAVGAAIPPWGRVSLPLTPDLSAMRRAQKAREIWAASGPVEGTVAETYLNSRGIFGPFPPSLRFMAACRHPAGAYFPALIARVEGGDSVSIHRTYLADDGRRKADATPQKAMLGRVSGGGVYLSDGPGPLLVAEGLETALSFRLFPYFLEVEDALDCALYPSIEGWRIVASLSTSGMRSLRLPDGPDDLTIAVDGDRPGREAAEALAERAAALGWVVRLLHPPEGRDWNDLLREGLANS